MSIAGFVWFLIAVGVICALTALARWIVDK